jgi:hypothetical protein
MNTNITTVVTDTFRSARLRRVLFTMPHVAPPGADCSSPHGGRKFELASFQGNPVEVYVLNTDGLPMYQGTVRRYAPGESLRETLRAVWNAAQPSKAARDAFEASCADL